MQSRRPGLRDKREGRGFKGPVVRTLTIIMPVLDEAEVIADALAALAPCRARGAEVIVVDGGSVDGTSDIARPLADQVIAAPRARAAQMNAGAAHARGGVLLFLMPTRGCRAMPIASCSKGSNGRAAHGA